MTRPRTTTAGLALLAAALVMPGCIIGAAVGGAIESYRQESTHEVAGQYEGLTGQSFAVIVAADRQIQANHPTIEAELTRRISERLKEHAGAAGYIPPDALLAYLLNNPNWSAQPLGQLAADLEVDRLIFVDLYEFHLHEAGNQYVWDGVAEGSVGVIEGDGPLPDDFAFQTTIRVGFPDGTGFGPMDFSGQQVASALLVRYVDRASWLFYAHQEDYYPKY